MDPARNTRRRARTFAGLLACCLGTIATARAAVSVYMPPETLAESAPLVVEARVAASEPGYDPRTGALATYVTLEDTLCHRGCEDGERLILREPGGRHGERTLEIDAAPQYAPGERVLAFLEQAPDGVLRTMGLFFGKFTIEDDGRTRSAVRELDGRGTILRGPGIELERLPLGDLTALAAQPRRIGRAASASGLRGGAERFIAVPPEYSRLRFETGPPVTLARGAAAPSASVVAPLAPPSGADPRLAFVPASTTYRARFRETDSGGALQFHIDPAGNPLGNAAAAVYEIERAMAAWNGVPESRVQLVSGNTSYDYRATHTKSPAAVYSGTNVVLFNDPYEEISDPTNCTGVLAIGGYWRTGSANSWLYGVPFYGILQAYVIFNDGFECVLGTPDDLAEIATHELGHSIGFGHSSVPDAIMRSVAYRYRGPRLGDDDRDAAHCFYPHTLELTQPDGGEIYTAGKLETISWTSTAEASADAGTVDLEYSLDGGTSWLPIAAGQPNDGSYLWSVPATATESAIARVVRRNRIAPTPSPFPAACSADASDAPFSIRVETAIAGAVPAAGLGLRKYMDGTVELEWAPSCSSDAVDYAVYAGSLAALAQGVYDLTPVACSTAGDTKHLMFAGAGDLYYLVAPRTANSEGMLGRASSGALRPAAVDACAPREAADTCE